MNHDQSFVVSFFVGVRRASKYSQLVMWKVNVAIISIVPGTNLSLY